MKCYVIVACEGEYSDHTEWPLLVFTDTAAAQAMMKKLCTVFDKYWPSPEFKGTDEERHAQYVAHKNAARFEYEKILGELPEGVGFSGETDWALMEAGFVGSTGLTTVAVGMNREPD